MSLILVSGALANKPGNGGAAWTRLSWILGFARMGHDVYFVEQIAPPETAAQAAFFERVTAEFGLRGRVSLLDTGGAHVAGLSASDIGEIAGASDVLINLSGHLTLPAIKNRCRRRVFIDLDPGYTQFWHAEGLAAESIAGHDAYFTVGENIGQPSCSIPTSGITWLPIRQPVLLDEWPAMADAPAPRFTTVASWRGPFGRIAHNASHFGAKAHEFRKFAALPARCEWPMEIALEVHPADAADVSLLKHNGWQVADPASAAGDPASFRGYVQASAAECSVAQGIYVETNSGWFSDRTVRYLASGRPALVQDTGFPRRYLDGGGVVTFKTLDEAAAGAESIRRNYAAHAAAARAIAEDVFDARKVLGELMDRLT
jgi:hypothetical protein